MDWKTKTWTSCMMAVDFLFAALMSYILIYGVLARGIDEYAFMWIGFLTLPLRLLVWDIRRLKGDVP